MGGVGGDRSAPQGQTGLGPDLGVLPGATSARRRRARTAPGRRRGGRSSSPPLPVVVPVDVAVFVLPGPGSGVGAGPPARGQLVEGEPVHVAHCFLPINRDHSSRLLACAHSRWAWSSGAGSGSRGTGRGAGAAAGSGSWRGLPGLWY